MLEKVTDEIQRICDMDRFKHDENVLYAMQMLMCWVQEEAIPCVMQETP